MRLKITIVLIVLLLLIVIVTCVDCAVTNAKVKPVFDRLVKLVQLDDFDDITLKIYYIDELVFKNRPWGLDDLINSDIVKIIVVSGSELEANIGVFKQIKKSDLKPVKNSKEMDAHIYYVFESKKDERLFDVLMWGKDASIFVDGLEVKYNEIFFDVMIPFLTEEAKEALLISGE